MTTRLKFQRACKLIPSAENMDTRTFVLHDGSLYFGGDRSWFKIEQFMDSDVNVYLEMKDINPIISMDGDITARKQTSEYPERTLVSFTNGKHILNLYCDGVDVNPPKAAIPMQPQEYQALPPMFNRGKNIFPLITEYATAGIISIAATDATGKDVEEGYFAVLNQRSFFALQGDPGLDIDLTEIPEVVNGIISQGAKIKLDNQIVHCMIEEDTYKIFSALKHARSRFITKQKMFMSNVARGDKEKDHSAEQPLVRIKVPVAQLMESLPIMDKLSHEGYITMSAVKKDNKMKLKLSDKVNNTFESTVDCETTEDININCLLIDGATMIAMSTAVGTKVDEAKLVLAVNPWSKHMLVRVEPNPNNVNVYSLFKIL